METAQEIRRRKGREKYHANKEKFKRYYEKNKEVISNKNRERFKDIKNDKEKYEERLRGNRENKRRYRLENKEKLKKKDKERYEKNKLLLLERTPEYLTPMGKIELIKKAIEFVNRVEKRNGLVSFEELFGELLDIAFYLPTSNYESQSVGEQLSKIWDDVKFFANTFSKKLNPDFDYSESKSKNLCKYCETNPITNTSNACGKCRTIEIYINRLNVKKKIEQKFKK